MLEGHENRIVLQKLPADSIDRILTPGKVFTDFTKIPSATYDVVYADPPWNYENWGEGASRNVAEKYPTMTMDELAALPVGRIAAESSVLFCWVTFPKLPQCLKVIEKWGFQYSTAAFVWVKTNRKNTKPFWGMGYWTRANAEVCLLAHKGKRCLPRLSHRVHSVIIAPVGAHSAKPLEVYERIEQLLGLGTSRIELFARNTRPGWDAFGNQVRADSRPEDNAYVPAARGRIVRDCPKRAILLI